MLDVVKVEPVRPADQKAQVAAALAPLLEEPAELDRVHLLAVAMQQRDERALRHALSDLLVVAHLDELQADVASQQLLVVRDVVSERRPQPPDSDDDDPHDAGILRGWKIPTRPSAISTSTSRRRSWRGSTRTSRMSVIPTTSSRS